MDVQNVLRSQTMVHVRHKNEWILASVHKLAANGTLVYVTTCDSETTMIIDLDSREAKDIKLALFGMDISHLRTAKDEKYGLDNIPIVLISLRDKLFELNGHLCKGILETNAAMKSELDLYRFAVEQIRMDIFEYQDFDIHILGDLIL